MLMAWTPFGWCYEFGGEYAGVDTRAQGGADVCLASILPSILPLRPICGLCGCAPFFRKNRVVNLPRHGQDGRRLLIGARFWNVILGPMLEVQTHRIFSGFPPRGLQSAARMLITGA